MPDLDLLAFLGGLLLTPGPTNLLLAVSSVSSGWQRSVSMLGAVVLAYLAVMTAIAVLATFVPADSRPAMQTAIKICATLWLLWLAYKVWTGKDDGGGQQLVTTKQVLVTTLVNPKAVIVALLAESNGMAIWLVVAISALVCFAGAAWILVGLMLRGSGSGALRRNVLRKASAICLAGFGILLAGASL